MLQRYESVCVLNLATMSEADLLVTLLQALATVPTVLLCMQDTMMQQSLRASYMHCVVQAADAPEVRTCLLNSLFVFSTWPPCQKLICLSL
jgi:hypothetical protein